MASLDIKSGSNEPVSLYCKTDTSPDEFLICSLNGQQIPQVSLDLVFIEGTTVTFFVKGKGKVHLTGYLTLEEDDLEFDENSDYDESEEEEVSEEELSPAQIPSGQKRAPAAVARPTVPVKKAKTQESPVQASNGKPAANGKAVAVEQDSDDDSEDDESDDLSDDGELQRMLAGLKKAKNASPVSGGDMSVDDEDDDDEDFDDEAEDDDDEEEQQQQKKIVQAKKDMKQNLQKPQQAAPQQQQQQQQKGKFNKGQAQYSNQKNTPGNTPGAKNFNQGKPFGQNKAKSPAGNQQKFTPKQQGSGAGGNNSFKAKQARFSGQKFSGKKQSA